MSKKTPRDLGASGNPAPNKARVGSLEQARAPIKTPHTKASEVTNFY